MPALLSDKLPRAPHGRFRLKVFRDGRLIERVDEPNLIVGSGHSIHANLLGGNFTGNNVNGFGVGTNGTAPAAGNTSLANQYTNVATASFPISGQVQFNFGLSSAEANGLAILEFGLFTASGQLYARKVRSIPLNKTSAISLSGSWIIVF